MKQTMNSTSQECISLKDLHDYYTTKFSVKNSHNENEFLKSARTTIETKYELIKDKVCEELKPSSANIRRLIGKLKPGCSAGQDGIEAEHLKYALDTDIILHLTNLVTIYFKFGVIPKSCY